MNDITIHVFTMATGIYNEYLNYQFPTIQHLFPGIKKTYTLLSDKKRDISYLETLDDYINVSHEYIFNLPYPLVTANKFTIIHNIFLRYPEKYKDTDYFLFVDADTVFCDKSNCKDKNIWNKILGELTNNDICYAISPWTIFNSQTVIEENKYNIGTRAYMEDNEWNVGDYAQASFLMGKINKIKEFDLDMCNLQSSDLNAYGKRVWPWMNDQGYLNRIVCDINKKNNKYKICKNWYIHNHYMNFKNNFNRTDYSDCEKWLSTFCICMQKVNLELKYKYKRNNIKFSIDI